MKCPRCSPKFGPPYYATKSIHGQPYKCDKCGWISEKQEGHKIERR